MDSVDFGGSVCRDTGVVVRRCECGFAGDFPKFGEFSDCEFGIFGVEACWFAEHCAAIPRLYRPSRSPRKDVRGKLARRARVPRPTCPRSDESGWRSGSKIAAGTRWVGILEPGRRGFLLTALDFARLRSPK